MLNSRISRRRLVAGALAGGASLHGSVPASEALMRKQSAPGAMVVITDVTVIDATGAPPLPHMTVVIEGERISEIRPTNADRNFDRAHVVDGAGRFLIPGLWDAHVHTFVFPWQPDLYFPLLIANGVTGVRDMGGAFPITVIDEFRSAIASGERVGPRIVAGMMVDGPTPVWPFAVGVGSAEEGRQAVTTITEAGADFIKVYTLLPREAYVALADAAKKQELPFAGHVPVWVTAGEASDAGQRSIEHYSDSMLPYCSTAEDEILAELRAAAAGPDPVQTYAATFFATLPRVLETIDAGKIEALAARFATNRTWFTPTLIIGHNAALAGDPARIADPRLRHLPPEVVASWNPQGDGRPAERTSADPAIARRSLEVGATITRTMQLAGAPLMAGTDLGLPYVFPGFSLHDELALLVQAGLSPLEALQAATRNTAQGVGLGDELGTVEVGKLADLVLLEADPLADITNTTRIAAVVANGRLLEQAELHDLVHATEPAVSTLMASPTP